MEIMFLRTALETMEELPYCFLIINSNMLDVRVAGLEIL